VPLPTSAGKVAVSLVSLLLCYSVSMAANRDKQPQSGLSPQGAFPPPNNVNDVVQRVFLILKALFGSTVALVLTGAIILIILLVMAILHGF